MLEVDGGTSLLASRLPQAGQEPSAAQLAANPLPATPFAPAAEVQDCALFGELAKFRHVRFLDVSRNRLRGLTQVCGMPSLLAVSAAGNALTGLPAPEGLRRLRWLQALDVSFNLLHRLDGVPARREAVAAYFAALEVAKAAAKSHGGGEHDGEHDGEHEDREPEGASVPGSSSRLTGEHQPRPVASPWLRELNLNGNALETLSGLGAGVGPHAGAALPASSGSALAAEPPCPRLARVDAQSNRIGPSIAGIGFCPSLEELYLSRNRLRSLGGLFGCAGLRSLHASRNRLDSLRSLADPTDASHRREWGWGGGVAGAGGAGEEDGEEDGEEEEGVDGPGTEGGVDLSEAVERARAAAEEEAAEAFSLPDDRSVARALVAGGGLPRSGLPAAGQPLPPVLTLLSQARLSAMPLADLLKHRRRLLAAVMDDCEHSAAAAAAAAEAGEDSGTVAADIGSAGDDTVAAGRPLLLPAAAGAGMPLRGSDAAVVAEACGRLLAACADAADRCTAVTESAVAAAALTPPSAHAAALALASPAASSLPRIERLDLSHNEGLASLAELVWLRALPSLRSLDLRGCPVSEEGEGMPLEALVWVGPHLTEINGQAVTDVHRRAAARERGRREKERRAWRRSRATEFAEAAAEAKAARESAAAEAVASDEDE